MALVVGIMGPSGSGKSSSWETCDKPSSYIINSDLKMFPFPEEGWRFVSTTNLATIYSKLNNMNKPSQFPAVAGIRRIMIDTANAIMIDDEMTRMNEVGYDKWKDLATAVYDLIRNSHLLRKDLIIYFFFHEDNWQDDDGIRTRRIKTNGKKLNKIELESLFTINIATVRTGSGAGAKYEFELKPFGSTVKVPRNIFPNDLERMPNDLSVLDKRLREVYKLPDVPTLQTGGESDIFFLRKPEMKK